LLSGVLVEDKALYSRITEVSLCVGRTSEIDQPRLEAAHARDRGR
jgi:hypothetical protein